MRTNQYFKFRCLEGLKRRGLTNKKEYVDRLNHEIDAITSMEFCSYFLVVADIVSWIRKEGIQAGPGRGSAAGSLCSYCLEITQVDPIKYNLIFERFLNPGRAQTGSPPDIDIDIDETQRWRVIEYIQEKYGRDCVAHIGTYGTLKAKGAVRVAAKVLGYPYQIGDRLANLILDPIAGKPQSLEICYEKVPQLRIMRNSDTAEAEILKVAEEIEGRPRAFSTHASGVIISPNKITRHLPLYPGKDQAPTTQFEMGTVEELGLVKFDFLGLRALTTIKRCCDLIKERHGKKINIFDLPVDDLETFQKLREGDNVCVFQLEASSGLRDLLVQVKPTCIEDLSTIIALFRPGPLGSDLVPDFLRVKAGQAQPNYLIADLEPILSKTAGVIVFQEQLIEVCKQLAGYSLAEADLMRRAVGKKKQKEMEEQEKKFKEGMVDRGYNQQAVNKLWAQITEHASYSFNASHSVSYCLISYYMSYLKTHYPLEFMCSCLISDGDEQDKVITYISECKRIGIPILPPDINKSEGSFSISDDRIRFGLSTIKYVGFKSAQQIISERKKKGPFKDFLNFIRRVDLSKINRTKIEALVWAGAFNEMDTTQEDLLSSIDGILSYKDRMKAYKAKLETYKGRMKKYIERQEDLKKWEEMAAEERKGKKKPGKLKVPTEPERPDDLSITKAGTPPTAIERLEKERRLLGYYISGHPLDYAKLKGSLTIREIKEVPNGSVIDVVAIPVLVKELTTKKKEKMAYLSLEDKTGTIQATVFPKTFSKLSGILSYMLPTRFLATVEATEVETEEGVARTTKLVIREAAADLSLRPLPKEDQPIELEISEILDWTDEKILSFLSKKKHHIHLRTKHGAIISVKEYCT